MAPGIVLPLAGAAFGVATALLYRFVAHHEGNWEQRDRWRVLALAAVISATGGTGLLGVRELFLPPLGPGELLGALGFHALAAVVIFFLSAFVAGAVSDTAGGIVGVLLVVYALLTLQGTVALVMLAIVAFGPVVAATAWYDPDSDDVAEYDEVIALLGTPLLAVGLSALAVRATLASLALFGLLAVGGVVATRGVFVLGPRVRAWRSRDSGVSSTASPERSRSTPDTDDGDTATRARLLLERADEQLPDRSVETPAARAIAAARASLEDGAHEEAVSRAETAVDRAEREAVIVEAIKRTHERTNDEEAVDELEAAVISLADGDYDDAVEHVETASEAAR